MTSPSIRTRLIRTLSALCLGVAVFAPVAEAATTTYAATFDATTGDDGSGSFVWDDVTKTMTSFSWSFAGGTAVFSDAGLAKTTYTGSARTVGALLFSLFTDPKAFWVSTNGLLSTSLGYFTTSSFLGASAPISGTFPADMVAISYAKNASSATFEMLDLSPTRTVLASGTVFAVPVPEPETSAMLLAGLGVLGGIARRRKTGRLDRNVCS